ncbi:hypothetical protein [Cupriavidus sp. USMAA2-4]|nr:hypothetical protein [Cupriavidus sp. USMAA2-4]
MLVTSKQIGNITITVSIEETAIDELEVTEHPVARGARLRITPSAGRPS